ncbi:RdgB/HAM1 family non-canonical purine NTP pyrophosphatase [Desulfovibrio sp. OttesenSCG-928-A18]|nr:RdgB/HAM1 family non-canonical purine NTP pyrophosphatase [Desulfovibrio sp. OttesenSCG-928-A18]
MNSRESGPGSENTLPGDERAVVLATRNQGKIREFERLLAPFGLTVWGLDRFADLADVEESGSSFAENALLKASTVSLATGRVALADDSGLEVDALDGAPGVFSARYSETEGRKATDEANLQKLLRELAHVPPGRRTARFRCCMAAATPAGASILAQGSWEGSITLEAAGSNGFGYDPVFFDPECSRTAAQMSGEEKNARSHRAKAVAALLQQWEAFWQEWLARRGG